MSDDKDTGSVDVVDGGADTGGGNSGDWRAGLPKELAQAPYFRSAPTLQQALVELNSATARLSDGNNLRVPGPDASPEQLEKFYAKVAEKAPVLMRKPTTDEDTAAVLRDLGMPDEADKYNIPDVEGIKLADERRGELKAMAKEAGLTVKQFEKFMANMLSKDAEGVMANQTAQEAANAELRGEWGNAYEQRMGQIARLMEINGAPDHLKAAVENRTISAAEARMWFKTADQLGGGGEGGALADQGKGGQDPAPTPDELRMRVHELDEQIFARGISRDKQRFLMDKKMLIMKELTDLGVRL